MSRILYDRLVYYVKLDRNQLVLSTQSRTGGSAHLVTGIISSRLNLFGTISIYCSRMRLFWIALAIVALVAIDRAYLDGQNTDQVISLVHWAGMHVTNWTNDLLRPLRR
jgi:succinate-acetate transporter protein